MKELISCSLCHLYLRLCALSIHIGIHFFGKLTKEPGIAWVSSPQSLWSSASVKVSRVQGTAKDTRHRPVSQWWIVDIGYWMLDIGWLIVRFVLPASLNKDAIFV